MCMVIIAMVCLVYSESAGMNGRKDALTLIAPKEIQTWLVSSMQLTELYLPYEINFIDVTLINTPVQINSEFTISAHSLHHRVASYAFAIEVTQQQKKQMWKLWMI